MLSTIYSLGLHRGKLINLKIADIDGDRISVSINNAKGKKLLTQDDRKIIKKQDDD